MSALIVRPATAADIPALVTLVRDAGLSLPDADYRDFTPPTLVVEDDNVVVGVLQCLVGRPYAVMMDMAVRADYRHRGVGRLLLAAMEGLLRSLGVTMWVTCVGDVRPTVQQALTRWGCEATGHGTAYMRRL